MIESVIAKLESNKPFLSIEVAPSLSSEISNDTIDTLLSLKCADSFVCVDSPLARLKPSSILSSIKLQNALNKPLICTLSMRDRNSIALCGDILGANSFNLRIFLSLTGDSINHGDCVESKGVFESSSLRLAKIIDGLNNGVAINGKALKAPIKRIYNCQVINAYANNPQSLQTKMLKKLSNAPLTALFTQPVYSKDDAQFLLESISSANAACGTNTALVLGFFPVLSKKVALFLRDKLPGVYIPKDWIAKLEGAKDAKEEQKIGLELSQSLFASLKTLHNKFHFMSANKPSLIREFGF